MEIKDLEVEQWMNLWETKCTYNVAETCVYSLSLDQLFELTGGDKQAFLDAFAARRLTYGDVEGRPDLLSGIAKLYRTSAEDVTVFDSAGTALLDIACAKIALDAAARRGLGTVAEL